jgi:hypothetical protein
MANAAKSLFRGAAATDVTTLLYTVPAATTTVITSIVVTNTATAGTFTLALGAAGSEVLLFDAVAIAADSSAVIDLKQVLSAAQVIDGGASATTINFHISGMEIS